MMKSTAISQGWLTWGAFKTAAQQKPPDEEQVHPTGLQGQSEWVFNDPQKSCLPL